jgi:hypothetical protein
MSLHPGGILWQPYRDRHILINQRTSNPSELFPRILGSGRPAYGYIPHAFMARCQD